MIRFRPLTLLTLVGALACEPPLAPREAARTPALSTGQGVVQSATGSAHRLSGDELFVLTFNAIKRADGTVTGRYHVDLKAADASFDVEVTCLSVVGNVAWVGGIIERSHTPLVREGTVSYFYAVDNGDGESGTPDVISGIRINDAAGRDQVFCTERPRLLSSRPIEHGNFQVRE